MRNHRRDGANSTEVAQEDGTESAQAENAGDGGHPFDQRRYACARRHHLGLWIGRVGPRRTRVKLKPRFQHAPVRYDPKVMETVTLTIDGRQVTVEKGKTVLQASIEAGISVPYYCYHPGIGVDCSCRVCIVKIEKMPKLQTSCSTMCADGMVVSTRTPEVVE